ncbi:HrpJ domain-containing protein [Enterobacter cloacae]|uniref:HrpJ domain-containing protein n=1 Tax=Enterobacter cloacae TaxID=550 RepID=UPI002FFB9A81
MEIISSANFVGKRIKNQFQMSQTTPAKPVFEAVEENLTVNLQEELKNAADDMAGLLRALRLGRNWRKNDSAENDYASSILEDGADEKLDTLIRQVAKLRDLNNMLNFARQFFPADCDLILVLREMLLSRKLSELHKAKIKESIADLEKFGDSKKMQSGINVGRLAKKFSGGCGKRPLLAKELRHCYLNFLTLEIPAGFIYKDWIKVYGYQNRTRLLSFTLSALVADMKANEPGIHSSEFGPLSAKLSHARSLHNLDQLLNESFKKFPFRNQMRDKEVELGEEDIVGLYITGLVCPEDFKMALKVFINRFMPLLLIKQRSVVIQEIRNIYNTTPVFLFNDAVYRDSITNHLSVLLSKLNEKEKEQGFLNNRYV